MSGHIALVVHNIRSTHNVGSMLRTADGMGVDRIYLTGYSPYPSSSNNDDSRLPHEANKIQKQINKTALGAQDTTNWSYVESIETCLELLNKDEYEIWALEQGNDSIKLPDFTPSDKIAIIVGNEVNGIDARTLELCKGKVEIPMLGEKESYNVAQAAAIALYHIRFCYNIRNEKNK